MSLKIDKIGKPLTNYTYTIALTNNNSLLISILYQQTNKNKITTIKSRIYELQTDVTYNSLSLIHNLVLNAFKAANTYKLTIKTDVKRNYVIFTYPTSKFYKFTGTFI